MGRSHLVAMRGERASPTIHDVTPRDGASDDKNGFVLGLENQGDGNLIFTLRAPWMVLSVKREATASPTEFPDLSGSLWCAEAKITRSASSLR